MPSSPIRTRMKRARALIAAGLTVALMAAGSVGLAASSAAAAPASYDVDDFTTTGTNSFAYTGQWNSDSGLPTDRWFAGTEHYASGAGNSVTFSFTGIQAKLFGAKHPAHGIYEVSVDGGTPVAYDGYAPTATPQQLIVDTGTLVQGPHSITVQLTDTKNPASTGYAGQVDYATVTTDGSELETAWSAIPYPTALQLDGGSWVPTSSTRVFVPRGESDQVLHEAKRLSSELAAGGALSAAPPIVVGDTDQVVPGDIVLKIGSVNGGNEAYSITSKDSVTVTGSSANGIFYGTRQLLQNLKARGAVPTGVVSGAPAVGERSLHIDIARKFYSASWIEAQIRDMSYVGLNTLELHFSENEGFRIQSDTYPQIASAEALTKDEVRQIIAVATDYHIEVVPSLDMPGHLGRALEFFPQLNLKDASGNPVRGALDITNPAALTWAKSLIDEYAELFSASTHWNLGADEFVDFEQMQNYPALQAAAVAKFGEGATGFDLLTDFANEIGTYVQNKGFTPRVWNDGMLRSTKVQLDKTTQLAWWTNWSPQMVHLDQAVAGGYDLINFNDSQFYYVLGENAGYSYPTSAKLWCRDWKPGVFPTTNQGPQTLTAPYPRQLLGASFAIWSDRPDAQTQEQVADGIRSPLRGMAERSWNDGSTLTLAQFQGLDSSIDHSPGYAAALPSPGSVVILPGDDGPTPTPSPTATATPPAPTPTSGPQSSSTPAPSTQSGSNTGSASSSGTLATTGIDTAGWGIGLLAGLLFIGGGIVILRRTRT